MFQLLHAIQMKFDVQEENVVLILLCVQLMSHVHQLQLDVQMELVVQTVPVFKQLIVHQEQLHVLCMEVGYCVQQIVLLVLWVWYVQLKNQFVVLMQLVLLRLTIVHPHQLYILLKTHLLHVQMVRLNRNKVVVELLSHVLLTHHTSVMIKRVVLHHRIVLLVLFVLLKDLSCVVMVLVKQDYGIVEHQLLHVLKPLQFDVQMDNVRQI